MKVSIILLYYNNWHLTHNRMKELYDHIPGHIEIVMINNGSTDQDCQSGAMWWRNNVKKHTINYYEILENKGFGDGHNVGARLSYGDVLIFLSNDVKISGDFVTPIVEYLKQDNNSLIGNKIIDWEAGWNQFGDYLVPYLEGWMLACTRRVWDYLGGFDDRYLPYCYEDIDLSMNAVQNGIALVELGSPHLRHDLGGTIGNNGNRIKITERNRERFRDKWKHVISP